MGDETHMVLPGKDICSESLKVKSKERPALACYLDVWRKNFKGG